MRITYFAGLDRRSNPIYDEVPMDEKGVAILKGAESITVWPTEAEASELDALCRDLMAEYGFVARESAGKRFPFGARLFRTPRKTAADARKALLPSKA